MRRLTAALTLSVIAAFTFHDLHRHGKRRFHLAFELRDAALHRDKFQWWYPERISEHAHDQLEGRRERHVHLHEYSAARLNVIKHVINDNGGTATAADFTLDSAGLEDSPDNFPGAESPGTTVTLDPGGYNVSESGPSGYTPNFSADCSGTIAAGQTKTCTVTNDDRAAHLIIIKNVVNDNVGIKTASAFSGTISGVTASGGNTWTGPSVNKTLTSVGNYSVTETADPEYDTTYSTDCTGIIAIGQTRTCTVTNNDKAAHLIIIKTSFGRNHPVPSRGGFWRLEF
jgi:hypothetical protein